MMVTKEQYDNLYRRMATSGKPEYMKVFGSVMNEMMEWMIFNKPDLAETMVGKLESINWKNYLTPQEAEAIVANMRPAAIWPMDAWRMAMESMGIDLEEEPYYNKCALWVEMNKQYSDHADTIATTILQEPLGDIPDERIILMIRALAIDVLKDKDGNYSIRRYFNL